LSAEDASQVEAPRGVGCGKGVFPSPQGERSGEGAVPLPRNFFLDLDFVNQLHVTIELIINQENCPIFIITGDFNLLCTDFLEEEFGFSQLVQEVTHGTNLLDKVFTNRPDLLCTTVHQSLLKTKHMAVVTTDVNCTGGGQPSCRRQHVKLYDHRTHNIDRLRYAVGIAYAVRCYYMTGHTLRVLQTLQLCTIVF